MIKLDKNYDDYVDINDPSRPGGAAFDTSTTDNEDGTPIKAVLINDIRGFFEAAIVEGNSGVFTVSGLPDRVGASDILNALKIIMLAKAEEKVTAQYILQRLLTVDGEGSGLDAEKLGGHPAEYYQKASSSGFFVRQISGPETVIPWSEINIDYAPEKTFCIFIFPHGNYKEFFNFAYETQGDGLHVFPQRIIDGQIIQGTRRKLWGTGKWGEGMVWVDGRKWGVGAWGSSPWDASRFVGGEAWGVYAPMPINIQVKEI